MTLFPALCGADLDGPYRYRLWRIWDELGDRLAWVMLNPSTANEMDPDPTMTKCMGFARRWGFGGIEIVNLYAFRTAYPKILRAAIKEHGEPYAVGPRNQEYIESVLSRAKTVVAAWGARPFAIDRAAAIQTTLALHPNHICLGITDEGHPRHPLYIPYARVPQPFGVS